MLLGVGHMGRSVVRRPRASYDWRSAVRTSFVCTANLGFKRIGIFTSCTPRQALRDDASFLGAVFDIIIGEVTEEIETVETEDIETDDTTPPTMVYSVITWGDIHG